jgi:hypothetical protein
MGGKGIEGEGRERDEREEIVNLSTMALGELYSEQGTPKEVPLKATSKMVVS